MAGIKISQLDDGSNIQQTDYFPVARGGTNETFKIAANKIVTAGKNTGIGQSIYKGIDSSGGLGNGSSALEFYSLSGTDENLTINRVGNTLVINTSAQQPLKYRYTGNGSQKNFAVGGSLSKNINNYRVDIDGVLQEPGADYSLAGTNISFTDAPPLSSKIVIVTNNLLKTVDAIPLPNSIVCNMLADSAYTCIGSFVGASPWRFVTTNFTLTASERVGTIATSNITGILPTNPAAGTMVTIADSGYNWGTYNITISADQPIEGIADTLICDVPGKKVVLLYTGTTWRTLW